MSPQKFNQTSLDLTFLNLDNEKTDRNSPLSNDDPSELHHDQKF